MRDIFQRAFYRYGWDTRCRNWVPARVLRTVLNDLPSQSKPVLLDVGCGRIGIVAFLDGVSVVGVDVEPPVETVADFAFHQGTITDLPFGDRSFPVVSCIDVIEHLPLAARDLALKELVRVASRAVLIACPHGETGRACDAEFQSALEKRRRPVPDWVLEHQGQPYPTSTEVAEKLRRAAAASGRKVKVSLSYCESVKACKFVREAAARSDALYVAVNFLLGALLSIMPAPDAESSYRMVMLAEFSPDNDVHSS